MELKQLLLDSVLVSSIILGLIGALSLSRPTDYKKYIGYYAILVAIFETLAVVLMKVFMTSNYEGLHLYTFLEFILINLYFHQLFSKFNIKTPLKLLLSIGCILIIYNSIFIQTFKVIPSNSRASVDFFIIVFSLAFYIFMIKNIDEKKKFKSSIFFITAIFIKASISIVIYLFSNSILQMQPLLRDQLFTFIIIINIVAIVLLFISLIIIIKNKINQRLLINDLN